jgi:imidazolonepropionase-like amidohydrolase
MLKTAFRSIAVLAAVGWSAAGQDERPAERSLVVVCGQLLAIPGRPVMDDAVILIRDGRIEAIEQGDLESAEREHPDAEIIDLSDKFVLPGLIDCHTHITSEMSRDSRLRAVEESDADAALNGVVYARRTIEAGFTTIRNVGSSGDAAFALRDAISAGKVVGPRILEAGESISPTGGHSDGTHGYREDLWDVPGPMQGIADGMNEVRKAVRAQVKRGADVIKLTATGGVLSATASGVEQQFFMDELEAIVETAHLLGKKVAAHAHGANGIKAALRAGVDSIEHGTYIDDEAIALFRETGAYLVPTILAGVTVAERAQEEGFYVPAVREKAAAVGPLINDAFARAYRGGVKIAFGTDSGVSRHGDNAREFVLMVEAGMPPEEAIIAATINAADLCGLSDQIGTLEPGKFADLIAVAGNPLEEISEMQQIVFVMKAGEVIKD